MTESRAMWVLLAASLPGRKAGTARVRLWRRLKDLGAASLRDGVTLLPKSVASRGAIATIAAQIEAAGGAAWVLELPEQPRPVQQRLRALFDRGREYQTVAPMIAALRRDLSVLDEAAARRVLRQIEENVRFVAALDFFPAREQARTQQSLLRLRAAIERRFSPAEPSRTAGGVSRRKRRDYQGAVWATRKRLWVDRVASAWLIRRFIDPRARFAWLDSPADCPRDAHGFDFDGAEFTHVGERVTFEVLLTGFGLHGDVALDGIARLVHYLDLGGDPIGDAPGFEAVLAGLRASSDDDDALLAAATPVLDALYEHYSAVPHTDARHT